MGVYHKEQEEEEEENLWEDNDYFQVWACESHISTPWLKVYYGDNAVGKF